MDDKDITRNKARWRGNPPQWLPIRGLSLLFDAPDECLVEDKVTGLRQLRCDTAGIQSGNLYAALYETVTRMETISSLRARGIFCLVPPPAYHVTVLSLFNETNVSRLSTDIQGAAVAGLHGKLGREKEALPELIDYIIGSDLVKQKLSVQYEYDKFSLFSTALVARLRPTPGSLETHTALVNARDTVAQELHQRFGIPLAAHFDPHITIGYFASETHDLPTPLLGQMESECAEISSAVSFDSIGMYTYSDMAHFFRI